MGISISSTLSYSGVTNSQQSTLTGKLSTSTSEEDTSELTAAVSSQSSSASSIVSQSTSELTEEEKKYDINNDGKLSSSEEAAMKQAQMEAKLAESRTASTKMLSESMDKMKKESSCRPNDIKTESQSFGDMEKIEDLEAAEETKIAEETQNQGMMQKAASVYQAQKSIQNPVLEGVHFSASIGDE